MAPEGVSSSQGPYRPAQGIEASRDEDDPIGRAAIPTIAETGSPWAGAPTPCTDLSRLPDAGAASEASGELKCWLRIIIPPGQERVKFNLAKTRQQPRIACSAGVREACCRAVSAAIRRYTSRARGLAHWLRSYYFRIEWIKLCLDHPSSGQLIQKGRMSCIALHRQLPSWQLRQSV
jgi:hypothetical protein